MGPLPRSKLFWLTSTLPAKRPCILSYLRRCAFVSIEPGALTFDTITSFRPYSNILANVVRPVRQLVSAKAQGVSPGEMKILQAYLELQNQDQSESVLFTDQTVKLFSNDQWAQRAIRKLGLLGLELVPSVRSRFAQSAMGLKP